MEPRAPVGRCRTAPDFAESTQNRTMATGRRKRCGRVCAMVPAPAQCCCTGTRRETAWRTPVPVKARAAAATSASRAKPIAYVP